MKQIVKKTLLIVCAVLAFYSSVYDNKASKDLKKRLFDSTGQTMDPHSFNADPDPVIFFNVDPNPDPAFKNCSMTF